jgi:hypothetical protein
MKLTNGIKISIALAILGTLMMTAIGVAGAMPVEEWSKTYGQSEADSIHQTSDGGYIFANKYLGITKVDFKGNLQWNKISGYSSIDSVQQTNDGGYIVIGQDNLYHIYLIKVDSTGLVQWNEDLGSGNAGSDSVHKTKDGGYILAYTNNNNIGVISKTNQNGIVQWSKSYGYIQGNPYGYPYSALQTTDGGYIAAGELNGHPWLVKIDSKGNEQWSKSYNYGMDDGAHSIQQTRDGGYIFTVPGTSNGGVVKVDSKGNEQWNQNNDGYNAVRQTNDGGYILTGYAATIIKIDSKGSEQWKKISQTVGLSIQQTTDEGYIIAGYSGQNAQLVKFSADVAIMPSITVTSPNGGEKWKHGTTHIIRWKSSNNPGANVKIELLKGTTISKIVSSAANSGSYSWKIPSGQAPATNYKIRITSTSNPAYKDTSNKNFIIIT